MIKIMCILGKDVHNKPVYQIYNEMIRRKYEVDVYAIYYEEIHLTLFKKDGIELHRLEEIKSSWDIEKYAFIYAAVPLCGFPIFRTCKKYIFSTPTTYTREVYFCNDFNFMTKKIKKQILENEIWGVDQCNLMKITPCMISGSPMHEGLGLIRNKNEEVILFIDSGHFPFGGKCEVAQTIKKIARALPKYTIRVKPRYLKGDRSVTHRNEDYLIDYLESGDVYPNIEVVKEHTDLREELENCYLVICDTVTTSYIEAALANRKIILLSGFPNEESKDITKKRVERQEEVAELTKCVINYKDVLNYLPEGLVCSNEFIGEFIDRQTGISESIVDAMEYIYNEFISKNIFPKNTYYNIDSYIDEMKVDECLSWDSIIQRRYRSCLYDISYYDARINGVLNFKPVVKAIEDTKNIVINEKTFGMVSDKIRSKLLELLIKNKQDVMKTALSQSYFFELLYTNEKFYEIQEEEVLCNAYYKYLKAKEYSKDGNNQKCIELLNEYFAEVDRNEFDKTLADETSVKASGHYFRGISYFRINEYEKAKEELEICDKMWNGNHKKAKEYIEIILQKLK